LGRGIGVAYFSRSGEFLGRLVPEISKNVPLRWAQFTAASDEGKTLAIAKSMVKGKLLNQRAILQREAREGVSGLALGHRGPQSPGGPRGPRGDAF